MTLLCILGIHKWRIIDSHITMICTRCGKLKNGKEPDRKPFHNNKLYLDEQEIIAEVENICECMKRDNLKINTIIAISRGGLIPARYFAKYLDIRRIYSLGIEFYDDVNKRKVPTIYQNIPQLDSKAKILIVDDVADSGESMDIAVAEVIKQGGKHVTTCALHFKTKSQHKPKYYGTKVHNSVWLVYPWEE